MWTPSKHPKYAEAVLQYPECIYYCKGTLSPNSYESTSERVINGGKRSTLLRLTDGFYAGNWKVREFEPEDNGIATGCARNPKAIKAVELTISMLNKKKKMNLQFKELVRVNLLLVLTMVYFLTIKASDNKFCEAKVYVKLNGKQTLCLIRHARHYPKVNPEFLVYDSTPAARND